MKIGPDNLVVGGDNPDGWRGKALHISLDRTIIDGHVQKTECSMFIRGFGSRPSVSATRQCHANALARNPHVQVNEQGLGPVDETGPEDLFPSCLLWNTRIPVW
jgi:hypothetical protein